MITLPRPLHQVDPGDMLLMSLLFLTFKSQKLRILCKYVIEMQQLPPPVITTLANVGNI